MWSALIWASRSTRPWGAPKIRDKLIRTDNGVPFASGNALFGLSKLSVWWLLLGINLQRIKPGHPEQNGRHERMHLTLKKEATKPASFNFLQQQERFDQFIGVTTTSGYTRDSMAPIRVTCMHFQSLSTSRQPGSSTRITIDPFGSRAAVASALADAKSTSVPCSLAKRLASERSPTKSGWSASCIMI